jgi:hypothetical protein
MKEPKSKGSGSSRERSSRWWDELRERLLLDWQSKEENMLGMVSLAFDVLIQ